MLAFVHSLILLLKLLLFLHMQGLVVHLRLRKVLVQQCHLLGLRRLRVIPTTFLCELLRSLLEHLRLLGHDSRLNLLSRCHRLVALLHPKLTHLLIILAGLKALLISQLGLLLLEESRHLMLGGRRPELRLEHVGRLQ